MEGLNKFLFVIPAKAGIQFLQYPAVALDPGLRQDDGLFRRSLGGGTWLHFATE